MFEMKTNYNEYIFNSFELEKQMQPLKKVPR